MRPTLEPLNYWFYRERPAKGVPERHGASEAPRWDHPGRSRPPDLPALRPSGRRSPHDAGPVTVSGRLHCGRPDQILQRSIEMPKAKREAELLLDDRLGADNGAFDLLGERVQGSVSWPVNTSTSPGVHRSLYRG